ncbi:hypothetical protein, partial [Pseudomonas sp. PGPR40]|uniref:hypothetical protein n=1 Tax=Pseudomonas sp. PGPR40 TaxID=2913476 RepID=UPI001EDACDB9
MIGRHRGMGIYTSLGLQKLIAGAWCLVLGAWCLVLGVHIRFCGNGRWRFRFYSQPFQGLRLNSPKTPVRVTKTMWAEVLARFEKKAPASVMVKL